MTVSETRMGQLRYTKFRTLPRLKDSLFKTFNKVTIYRFYRKLHRLVKPSRLLTDDYSSTFPRIAFTSPRTFFSFSRRLTDP